MQDNEFVLVSLSALPEVFSGVLYAKQLLAEGKAANATQATRMAGISRSAFYKYRDCIFPCSPDDESSISLSVSLSDKAGVFSAMTSVLYENGANLITVNQGKPINGIAAAELTIATAHLKLTADELLEKLKVTDGVISVRTI